jgi:hypothetical protein
MDELSAELGASAVRTFSPPLRAADLRAALEAAPPDPAALLGRLREHQDWDAIAERTLSLYRQAAA